MCFLPLSSRKKENLHVEIIYSGLFRDTNFNVDIMHS